MSNRIAIIDYGLGNLHSVQKAFRHLGHEATVVSDPAQLADHSRIVLPGVGAFADGMGGLRARGFDQALGAAAADGKALLGICLGAQLLLDGSEEFGHHTGLGLIPGKVVRVACADAPVPHVGWARLTPPQEGAAFTGVVRETVPGSWMYFIHSYHMVPARAEDLIATCSYGESIIHAAVQHGAVAGVQFHPEKSGREGIKILDAFSR